MSKFGFIRPVHALVYNYNERRVSIAGCVHWLGDRGHTCMHFDQSMYDGLVQGLYVTTSCQSVIFVHGSYNDSSALSWCRNGFYQ